jgi:hypothetical protein
MGAIQYRPSRWLKEIPVGFASPRSGFRQKAANLIKGQ